MLKFILLSLSLVTATLVENQIQPPEFPYPQEIIKAGDNWKVAGDLDLDWFFPITQDETDYSDMLPEEIAQFKSPEGNTKVTVYGRSSSTFNGSVKRNRTWRLTTETFHVHRTEGSFYKNWILTLQTAYYNDVKTEELTCQTYAMLDAFIPHPRANTNFNIISSDEYGQIIGLNLLSLVKKCDPNQLWTKKSGTGQWAPGSVFELNDTAEAKLMVRSKPSKNLSNGFGLSMFLQIFDRKSINRDIPKYMMIANLMYNGDLLVESYHTSVFVLPASPDYDFTRMVSFPG